MGVVNSALSALPEQKMFDKLRKLSQGALGTVGECSVIPTTLPSQGVFPPSFFVHTQVCVCVFIYELNRREGGFFTSSCASLCKYPGDYIEHP